MNENFEIRRNSPFEVENLSTAGLPVSTEQLGIDIVASDRI